MAWGCSENAWHWLPPSESAAGSGPAAPPCPEWTLSRLTRPLVVAAAAAAAVEVAVVAAEPAVVAVAEFGSVSAVGLTLAAAEAAAVAAAATDLPLWHNQVCKTHNFRE